MKQIFLKSYSLTQHLIAFILIHLLFLTGCYSGIEIQNPYSQVDWKKDGLYKANLHTHTARSDGSVTPQGVVDNYSKLGYHILAISDHNEMTYPWTEFEKLGSTNQLMDRLATGKIEQDNLVFEDRYLNDLAFCDSILVRMMPEKPVWDFSNDDLHGIKKIGHNWNILILPEHSQYWVRRGMEEGRFFFIYTPTGHNGSMLPQINES